MKNFFIIFSILFISFSFSQTSLGAGRAGYTPLAPIPGLTGEQALGVDSAKSSPGLSKYLSQLYTWVVAAASGLAVVMIMWGGVEYMTSAGGGGVEEAKKRISAAVLGLLLALGSYIILGTVNKDLLKLNFDLGTLNVQQNPYETFTSNAVDKGPIQQQSSSNPVVNGSRGAMGGAVNNQPNISPSNNTDTSGSLGGDVNPGSARAPSSEPELPSSIEPVNGSQNAPNLLLPTITPDQ